MGDYEAFVVLAKQKDADAFAALYEMVYQDMYHMAFYMLGNAEDAEDVVSDTVLAAFESIQKLRNAEAFRGWIFKILLNQCKRKRKQYVKKTLPMEFLTQNGGEDAREYSLEEALDVRQAFMRLAQDERTILAMSVFGGYKSEEIAVYLHMKAVTVRSRRSRALQKLQDMLSGTKQTLPIGDMGKQ